MPGCLWNGEAYEVQPRIFVYILDESFSKHATQVLLHLVLVCMRAILDLIHALRLYSSGMNQLVSPSYSLILGQ